MRAAGLVLLVALSACAAPVPSCLLPGQTRQLRITLYFGLDRPDGGQVSDAEWRGFVSEVVTPRFPDGLTVLDGQGQWRDRTRNRIGSEPSRMLLLTTPPVLDLAARVQAIRTLYRQRFDQQSVGVESLPVCAGFT